MIAKPHYCMHTPLVAVRCLWPLVKKNVAGHAFRLGISRHLHYAVRIVRPQSPALRLYQVRLELPPLGK